MATRTQTLIPITIAAVIIGVIGLLTIPSESKIESVEFPRGTIQVDGVTLEVQIADNEPRRTRGLMFQDELPPDQGMIFVHDAPGIYSLWMPNMQFPLDMLWFDSEGRLVHIEQDVPPCQSVLDIATCPSIVPPVQATYILEVTAGFVERNGITKDSVLTIISI